MSVAELAVERTIACDAELWEEQVHAVSEKLTAHFPEILAGRIAAGRTLALDRQRVTVDHEGIWSVASDNGTTWYALKERACQCKDFVTKGAPQGWCKHRLAGHIAAEATTRMQEAWAQEHPPAAPLPLPVDADPSPAVGARPPRRQLVTHSGAVMTDAPCSVNVSVQDAAGYEFLLTVRGQTPADLWAAFTDLRERLHADPTLTPYLRYENKYCSREAGSGAGEGEGQPRPQGRRSGRGPGPSRGPQRRPRQDDEEDSEGWCAKHSTQMHWNEPREDGDEGWWSHAVGPKGPNRKWCKGY